MNAKGFILEDRFMIVLSEEDIGAYIIVGVLGDLFEDGGVLKSYYLFGTDLR